MDEKTSGTRICAFCGERFERGRIYRVGEALYDSRRAVQAHVSDAHGGAFNALLALGRERTGLSEVQEIVLRGLYEGSQDSVIAKDLGDKALSTVRNHRRNLRKRAEEARIFLALMDLIEERLEGGRRFVRYSSEMPVRDERLDVTEEEAAEIERRFFSPDGRLVRIPPKEKQKLVVLRRIVELFRRDRTYTEAELRLALSAVHEDHALLRRYLVDYRFMEREPDGSAYRRL